LSPFGSLGPLDVFLDRLMLFLHHDGRWSPRVVDRRDVHPIVPNRPRSRSQPLQRLPAPPYRLDRFADPVGGPVSKPAISRETAADHN
jgi:hypothetical protein